MHFPLLLHLNFLVLGIMSDDLVFCLPIEKARNKPIVSGDFSLSLFISCR